MPLERALAEARAHGRDLVLEGQPDDDVPRCAIKDASQLLYDSLRTEHLVRLRERRGRLASDLADDATTATMQADVRADLAMSVVPDALIRLWGDQRRRVNWRSVKRARIPTPSQAYLVEIGLPADGFLAYRLDFDSKEFITLAEQAMDGREADALAYAETVRRLERVPAALRRLYYPPLPLDLARYWRLGDDSVSTLCIEEGSGAVVKVTIDQRGHDSDVLPMDYSSPELVNSSVELFGQFLYLFQTTLVERTEGEITARDVRYLSERFHHMDPPAMEYVGSRPWPPLLEEALWYVDDGYDLADQDQDEAST